MMRNLPPRVASEADKQRFLDSLSAEESAAVKFVFETTTRIQQENAEPYIADGFVSSLFNQFKSTGKLSKAQVDSLVYKHKRHLEDARIAEGLNPLKIGDVIEVLQKFHDVIFESVISQHHKGKDYIAIIRFSGEDGRNFKLTTSSKKAIAALRTAKETGEPLMLKTKVKWIAPNKIMTVLGCAGTKIQRLFE